MTEIMVLGDTHGNTNEAVIAVQNAAALNIQVIIQCGDFGLWDHKKDGIGFLDELNAELLDNGIYLVWVDGNHENFDRLEWYCANNPKNQWGQVFIRSNILYSPRGCKWKMDGKHFMTVGGAVSIDKSMRKRGESWWPQEQLTEDELELVVKRHEASPGPVDYLFTHDCPTNAPFRERLKNDPESQVHRQRMDVLGKAIKPGLWFHGHMHTQYDGYEFPTYEPTTTVYGLECDGMKWNWGILDTEDNSFRWGRPLEAGLLYGKMDLTDGDEYFDSRRNEWTEWKDDGWLDRQYDSVLPD